MTATVVLLNGVGSVGKGSVAKALQEVTREPFLHVAMDAFLDMLPPAYWDHDEGLRFVPRSLDGETAIEVTSGAVSERLLAGMRLAVRALAEAGNNVIVDEVAERAAMAEYERLLAPFRLYRVALMAPLAVLEERERARGDRMLGLARWQVAHLHEGQRYDLEVDTSAMTPLQCAEKIRAAFGL
ncbi:MAG TPA: chloramphenicol phosphotransferase [Kiloniellales bacterium]|nr:chloramphenicol phosphotransferase [Kiloniellales bacterium]